MVWLGVLLGLILLSCGGGGTPGVTITWSTSELTLAYTPATKTSVEVSFTSDTDLGAVEARVTQELDPFIIIGTSGDDVVAGDDTTLDVIVLLGSNDLPGVVTGDIELVRNGNVIARLPVTLEIIDDTFVVDSSGGTFSGTGNVQLIVPAGVFTGNVSVALRTRDDLGGVDGHTPPAGYEPLAYTELVANDASFLGPVDIAVSKPPDAGVNDKFVVTLFVPGEKEEFVDIAEVDGDWLVSRQSALPFTGIVQSGFYIFYRALFGLNGFVTGTITDENLAPVKGAVCTLNISPFTTTSNAQGNYVCFVPHGSVVVSAVDPTTQAFASGVSFTSPTHLTNTLDLQLRPVDLLTNGELANGAFADGLAFWDAEGAVDVVSSLGPITPGFDDAMAKLSTGFGSVDNRRSTLRQTFRMPECSPGELPIIVVTVRYQFLSEEYNEFVNTQFNDQMLVELSGSGFSPIKQVAVEDVNGSTFDFVSGIDFPGGDSSTGATGWLEKELLFVNPGGVATVQVSVEDNGDAIYDSVALVDLVEAKCVTADTGIPRFLGSPLYYAGKNGNEGLITNSLFDHDYSPFDHDPADLATTFFTTATTAKNSDGCHTVPGTKDRHECLWDGSSGVLPDHYNRELNKAPGGKFYLAYDNHRGIDFRTRDYPPAAGINPATGKPFEKGFTYVCAAHDGWVYVTKDKLNTLAVEGSDEAEGYTTLYSHLSVHLLTSEDRSAQRNAETDSEIRGLLTDLEPETRHEVVGYLVTAGQVIAISGDTGAKGRPHLHFGIVAGTDIDIDPRFDPFGWDGNPDDDPYKNAPSYYLWKDSVVFADLTK